LSRLTPDSSHLTRKTARRAVFLDRDGTINIEKHYLHRPQDFEFIPGAPEAIKKLKDAGYLVVVVTNQSGVGRGYYTLADVDTLHAHIQRELAAHQTSIDAFYACPHHPSDALDEFRVDCDCRKPEPGMILTAAEDLGIDLDESYIVGDKRADIEAGRASGCTPLLVRTGYGQRELNKLVDPDFMVFDSIRDAADFIINSQ